MNPMKRIRVRRKRVTAKDIQENIHRIMEAMKRTPEGTEEYDILSKELEHEYVVLKKYRDAKFYIAPKDYMIVGGVTVMVIFFVCLEREVPSAMKFVNLVLKLVPFKG